MTTETRPEAVCRRCGQTIRLGRLGWGHVSNPGPRHHYAIPKAVPA